MNSSQMLKLIVKLAGFKLLVRTNRFGSDSELAREVHDSVIVVLDGYRAELAELIRLTGEAARETDPDRREDLTYHLVVCKQAMERNWYEGQPFEIGGWHRSEPDGSFRNPVTGETQIAGDVPLVVEIPQERLCGLRAILDDIETECRVAFTYDMVFYKPRPRNSEQYRGIAPFDPDADIPW